MPIYTNIYSLGSMINFLMSLSPNIFEPLARESKKKGVTIQALIRHILGTYVESNKNQPTR